MSARDPSGWTLPVKRLESTINNCEPSMNQTIVRLLPPAAAFICTCAASADFVGWTATARSVSGGTLVNVFAVTNSATDRLISVYGGRPSNPGFIATNSPGGFLQGAGSQGAFRPDGSQSWDAADSFLTIGGGFDSSTGTWSANSSTFGDPGWMFSSGGPMLDGFSTLSSPPSLVNPWTNAVPSQAGWYTVGTGATAQSLSPLSSIMMPFSTSGGIAYGSSSAAAASGMHGFMVAQLFVADLQQSVIHWNMGATIRRANGTSQQGEYAFTMTLVPGPAGIAVFLGMLGSGRRRRR